MGVTTQTARARIVEAGQAVITNLTAPVTPLQEFSHTFQTGTKRFIIKSRDGNATIRVAAASGETSTKYFTIPSRTSWSEESLDLASLTIYLSSDKSSHVVEIIEWV